MKFMDKLQSVDGILSTIQTDLIESLLSILFVEETVSGMVGPYTVPLGDKPTAKPPGAKKTKTKNGQIGHAEYTVRRSMLPPSERAV